MSGHEKAMRADLNFELFFVTEVLKLSSLHYGYWEEGQASGEIDLAEVRRAQSRFTDELLSFVPENVNTILDVGSGVGDNAHALAAAGYRVTAISPDQNHIRYFDETRDPNITFHNSKFEDFTSDEEFDLLFFHESSNYFDRDVGMQQCRRLVRPGGYLLVSGMFRHANGEAFPDDFDLSDLAYVKLAREYGFVPDQIVDVTPNVLPTMVMAHRAMQEYVEPVIEFAGDYLQARIPWKVRVFKFLVSKQIKAFQRKLRRYRRKTDPDRYRERVRYVTMLLKDTAGSPPGSSAK